MFIHMKNPDLLREHHFYNKLDKSKSNFGEHIIQYDDGHEHKQTNEGHAAKFAVDGWNIKPYISFMGAGSTEAERLPGRKRSIQQNHG